MKLYNTMSRSVEEFASLKDGEATIYTCGPTVYRRAHIGNLRTYITADLLVRALSYSGWDVAQVINITDVGHMVDESSPGAVDKMLLSSDDEGLSPAEIAERYTEAFLQDCDALNIHRASHYPRATDHISEMLEITQKLLEKDHAYEVEGTVYFDVDSFENYGRLSHNTKDKLKAGSRLEALDSNKRNHYDFTLWRNAGARRLLSWDSPWGKGYPGWHIECSAMSLRYLGERFDIHTGGSDHIFPHHECEIAQSEAYVGHTVVGHWLHAHHLLVDGAKMAKSERNDLKLDDVSARTSDPLAFRYLVMQTRYRSQENFTMPALDAAAKGLDHLRSHTARWSGEAPTKTPEGTDLAKRFTDAISADLDMPRALKVLAELPGAEIPDGEKLALVRSWDEVLGLDLVTSALTLPDEVTNLMARREAARKDGDYDTADALRSEIAESGFEVIDTPEGSKAIPRGRDAKP